MENFKSGDKVNWLGALGFIVDILEDGSLVVDFDDKMYFFEQDGRFLPNQEPTLRKMTDA